MPKVDWSETEKRLPRTNRGDYRIFVWLSEFDDLKATATRRKKLLRRCKPWLDSYLAYLDTDIPITGEPNKSVSDLIIELAEELDEHNPV